MKRSVVAWVALIVPLWIVLVLCTHWEPIIRDGWSNIYWHRWHDVDLSSAWGLIKHGWLGSNPRLGQTVTTLLYTPGPYHAIVTPPTVLLGFWMMTALVLGRSPSIRRADDALVFVTVIVLVAIATPQFGLMLFYRPYLGNYFVGLVLNLMWLVPFRFHLARPGAWGRGVSIAMTPLLLVLGVIAGMCNEHTGPAFFAGGLAITIWSARRGHGVTAWMVAGLVGLLAGYILMMAAPGHDIRYSGLATQSGVVERFLDRGVRGNARVFLMLALHLLPMLPWVAIGAYARRRSTERMPPQQRHALLGLAAIGLACTVVLLGSPKLGGRLYFATIVLIAIALTGWLVAQLHTPKLRIAAAVLSGGMLCYGAVRCVVIYHEVGTMNADRVALIQTSAPQSNLVVPRYRVSGGKFFVGEDFIAENLRIALAADYGLGSIKLADGEISVPK